VFKGIDKKILSTEIIEHMEVSMRKREKTVLDVEGRVVEKKDVECNIKKMNNREDLL
jgi:neutral trehalase